MQKTERNLEDFEAQLSRLQMLHSAKNIKDLLEKIEIPRGTYDNWRNKKKIPDKHIIKIAEQNGVTVEWIKSGSLPKYRIEKIPPPALMQQHPLTDKIVKLFNAVEAEKQEALYKKIRALILNDIQSE